MIIEFWWTRQLSRSWARYYRSFFQEPKVERTTCLREIFKKLFLEQNNIIHVEIYSERRNANMPYKGNACYYSVGMSLKMKRKYIYIYVVCKKNISHKLWLSTIRSVKQYFCYLFLKSDYKGILIILSMKNTSPKKNFLIWYSWLSEALNQLIFF